jgi:carboxymethylenebutenolidase
VPNPRNVVDELILKFTHSREIDYLLPGVAPTGKYVELPHVVVMKFVGKKIAHEHIYWDQASLLAQTGLLDANANLPVKGIEQSRKLQELATSSSSTNTTRANHRRII